MKMSAAFVVALLATGAVASTPAYSQTTVTTDQPTIVMGEVVRYEPGRIIVLRNAENNEVTYMLTPKIMVPAGVAVGRPVTLYTTHGEDGAWTVTRVSTSVTPEGNVQRTVERTRTNAEGETTRSTSTEVIGTVRGFEPGHSITVVRPDGTEVTYMAGGGDRQLDGGGHRDLHRDQDQDRARPHHHPDEVQDQEGQLDRPFPNGPRLTPGPFFCLLLAHGCAARRAVTQSNTRCASATS